MFKLLGLDKLKYLNKRLDKKLFYDNTDLSKADKKIFVDYIDRLEMSYVINKDQLNISEFIDEEYCYKAIIYLKVRLKQDGNLDKISRIINNSIPNPLVIIYQLDDKYKINTAIKRLKKNEKGKTIIEEVKTTSWIDVENLDKNQKTFLDSISIRKLPYSNLFDFYKAINDKIYIFGKSEELGEYKNIEDKKELEQSKEIVEQIESLQIELNKTIKKLKKERQLNRQVELNVKATDLNKQIENLKNKLK